jgi:isopentenyl diphosphate isomerase/L-lactate dehydrogenase-like FMN-dependent dehydrogenase
VYKITDEGIHGDHALGFQFAEGNMDGPLVGACGAQTVVGQVDAFADTHAGGAEQEEDISAKIVATHQLLLQEMILLGGERTGQTLWRTRNILTPNQVSEFGKGLRINNVNI